MTHLYRRPKDAIRHASNLGPMMVGWDAQQVGWVIYSPGERPEGVEEDIYCPGDPKKPIAISVSGAWLLHELGRSSKDTGGTLICALVMVT
jgi:hypothetical protein